LPPTIARRDNIGRQSSNQLGTIEKGSDAVTITLELPSELEVHFVAEAKAKGVPVAEIIKAYLVRERAMLPEPVQMRPEEWDQAWDELLDSLPDIPH
jgi:hypothetical protein